ncbi:hypothetical protein BDQ17DRAFT_1373847 [Cyathus striatus]|nr:hypothetical protein BDQ17DRAFT_1373847 [Cyathus striatus]
MSPLLRVWICVFFVQLAYAGLVNVTVDADDPRIVYSDGWQTGSCGMEACGLHESVSFRFTGVALYYVGGPSSSSNSPSINVTLDRDTMPVDLSAGGSNQNCDSISFSTENLEYEQHGVNVTLAGTAQVGDCVSFNGFIYTTFDNNTSHTTGSPAATSTSTQSSRGGSHLSMILGLSIGAAVLCLLITGLLVYMARRRRQAPVPAPVPMLDRSMNWALGRKINHKKRDSMLVQKAGPAKDFVAPPEHDRNWQELR